MPPRPSAATDLISTMPTQPTFIPVRSAASRWLRAGVKSVLGLILLLALAWAFGALWFDFPGHKTSAWIWLAALVAMPVVFRKRSWCKWIAPGMFLLVWLPWLGIRPSNTRDWAPEYARTARAEIDGDVVTVHNIRNFDYVATATPGEFTMIENWETRRYRLSELRGIDSFINYWGSPWLAHPIISFDFGPDGHLAFSIETRRERTEGYSALAGLYKVYELTILACDERDVIRVRTNFRKGEDVYLYRLNASPRMARERFTEYAGHINRLSARPKFYDVLFANCTTTIRAQIPEAERRPMDWRLLLNGKMDELMYSRNAFAGDRKMGFDEMKKAAWINPVAVECGADPAFSDRIRSARPGFQHP